MSRGDQESAVGEAEQLAADQPAGESLDRSWRHLLGTGGGSAKPATDGRPTPSVDAAAAPAELYVDSLAFGVAFMFGLNVIQRVVGLARNMLLCRLLGPEELGRWNLAFSFLLLAAPLAVLGLPGVFGRYVEHYRQQGRLRSFLRRITLTTGAATLVAVVLITLAPEAIARLVFNDPAQTPLIRVAGAVLVLVIVFNFLVELLTALRQVRLVSIMQFAHSFTFAVVAVGLLAATSWRVGAVVAAYSAGCAVAAALGLPLAWTVWRQSAVEAAPQPAHAMWRKLVPFAVWIWATNILANMFHVVDRYMLVHFANTSAQGAAALVGQYHSARVLPELMLAAATLLSSVLLPYLANRWEAGDREAVWRQLALTLKLAAIGFTFAGAALLLCAPLLFGLLMGGQYHAGLAVLPATIVFCTWTGMLSLATNYLWCRERPMLGSAALAVGVVANLVLNLLLVPRYGLNGAVMATAVANAAALSLTYYFNMRLEMPISRGLWLASAAPLVLLAGPAAAVGLSVLLVLAAWRTAWLLTTHEKQAIAKGCAELTSRVTGILT